MNSILCCALQLLAATVGDATLCMPACTDPRPWTVSTCSQGSRGCGCHPSPIPGTAQSVMGPHEYGQHVRAWSCLRGAAP